jgi:hypothetical protein
VRLTDVGLNPGMERAPVAFELLFPDGLELRVSHGADRAVLERLVARLLRRRG